MKTTNFQNNHCNPFIILAIASFCFSSPLYADEEAVPKGAQVEAANGNTAQTESKIKTGETLFNNLCKHCHTITYEESAIGAPGLRSVLERHDEAWLNQWIKNPESFGKNDVTARDLIDSNPFGLAMPALPLMQDDDNRAAIIEYLKTLK